MSKIIAVTGATGQQGGAVVRALLNDGTFKVRGITRNVNSPKARLLQDGGVEMVAADYDDKTSLEEAFRGCYGAFLVTNFFETMSFDKECEQGVNLADAAKSANVQHVVWSTAEDTQDYQDDILPLYKDHKVTHFDTKGYISKYMERIKLPVTHLYTSPYVDNFTSLLKAKRDEDDGTYKLSLPMKDRKLAVVAVDDIGKIASVIFNKAVKGHVGICSDQLTITELACLFTKVTGEKFVYVDTSEKEAINELPLELYNMFKFFVEHDKKCLETRSLERVRSLITPVSIEEWARRNNDGLVA